MSIHGGCDEFIARWVIDRLGDPDIVIPPDFGNYWGLAVMCEERLVAGCIFHGWSPSNRNILVSFASGHQKWATRGNIATLLRIPFEALNCNRITAMIREDNLRSRKLVEGLGFQMDCILRGTELVLYGMIKEDYDHLIARFGVERYKGMARRDEAGPGRDGRGTAVAAGQGEARLGKARQGRHGVDS